MRRFLGILVALLAGPARGIYEDQAGVIDWHRRHVGRVTTAVVREQRSYVASTEGLVAALRHSDGEVLWRYEMPDDQTAEVLRFLPASGVLVLAGDGRSLRKLSHRGSLLWDLKLVSDEAELGGAASALEVAGATAFAVADNAVTALDAASGLARFEYFPENDDQLVARHELEVDSLRIHGLRVNPAASGVSVVATGRARGGKTRLVVFGLGDDGAPAGDVLVADLQASFADARILDLGDRLVAVAADQIASIVSGKEQTVQALASLGIPAGETVVSATALESQHAVVLTTAVRDVTLRLEGGSFVASAEDPGPESVVGLYAPSRQGTVAVLRGALRDGVLQLAPELASYTRHPDAPLDEAAFQQQMTDILARSIAVEVEAPLAAFWPFLFVEDGIVGMKVLAQFADGTLVLVEGEGRVAWAREEGLAAVTDVTFVTRPPASLPAAADGSDPLSLGSRMRAQLRQLEGLRALLDLPGVLQAHLAQRAFYKGGVSEEASDHFGFAKIAVVLTAPDASGRLQKVFGIDVRDGTLLWKRVLPSSGWRLLTSRPEAHKGLGPEALLLLTGSEHSKALLVDATSGETQAEETLPYRVETVLDLGVADPATFRRLLAFVADADSDQPEARLYPADATPPPGAAGGLHFHRLDDAAGRLRTFTLPLRANASAAANAEELGGLSWSAGAEKIVSVAYSDASSIKSATHELGDGSLLIKYLNPNLAAVATLRAGDVAAVEAAPAADDEGGDAASTLFLNVVDVVSGKVLYRVAHRNGAAPLHLTLHENWVIYSYWNSLARRTEIGVVALFEGHVARKGLNPFNKPERASEFSAFEDEPPIALQRSFQFPHGIKALGITKTTAGITPRACIVGMESGQLFLLDRRLLDPRRPAEAPKPSEKEEGLMQYSPFLPLHPTRFVNYNATIVGLRRIYTTPTRLESTALVLGVGVDLYGTRTTPVKSFDLLAADFNKPLLLLVLAGFVGGTVILRTIYRTRRLKQQWK